MPRVLATALATATVVARLARGRRRRPPLRTGAPQPDVTVSVVVPARDEEERLPACLDALAAETDAYEVIVVDDESADATAAIAEAAGVRLVRGSPLPDGWAGKAWALQQGLDAARGEVVVFLDADARVRPGLLRALAARLAEDADLLSVGPRFTCRGGLERALHASMLATLVLRFGPTDVEGWQPSRARAVANGQCIACRADELRAAGGWARVAGSLVEDVALARALRGDGWRVAFADAAELLDVRMYESARETWTGWGRSLMGVGVTSPAWLACDLALLWVTAGALPRAVLLRRRSAVPLAALRLALLPALARTYRPRGLAFWLSPLLDLPVTARLTWSVVRPDRAWRGRTYGAPRTAARSSS
jgi:dolichol-phosphate mannosyltransferase